MNEVLLCISYHETERREIEMTGSKRIAHGARGQQWN